jgi:predicted PhzF superfamily epimerase YddE/YHI9
MRLPLFQVDAFASAVFRGNPAAVVPLEDWLDDATMQAIAAENNLSETAFVVREGEGFRIRWFTPEVEVPLCGHATLATAWVLFHSGAVRGDVVHLSSASGPLSVTREGELLALDFPVLPVSPGPVAPEAIAALGDRPDEVLLSRNLLFAVYSTESRVRALTPELSTLARTGHMAVVTAPGDEVDFVSRFFAPNEGIPEDPVTGSAHCSLTPYWAARLGKTTLRARQVSRRGGELECTLLGDRVKIAGRAVRYLEGTIEI